jgi:hypothetical protein
MLRMVCSEYSAAERKFLSSYAFLSSAICVPPDYQQEYGRLVGHFFLTQTVQHRIANSFTTSATKKQAERVETERTPTVYSVRRISLLSIRLFAEEGYETQGSVRLMQVV